MDQEKKHSCKLCNKNFPCGRSLGGHMRCHVPPSSRGLQGLGADAYGLRENPKKSWRVEDQSAMSFCDLGEKQCRECGREFQSWKALFGHMRSHSDKIGRAEEEEEEDDGEGSWGDGGSHIEGSVKVPKKKRRSRPRRPSPSFEYSKEQKDAAIALVMLSKDVGHWGSGSVEFSDKSSAVSEGHQDLGSDELGFLRSKKLAKYECTACNKSFNTYQALGGHRASHKRMRDCFENGSTDQVVGAHQCLICGKVFSSGQALGGHKRSHLITASPSRVIHQEETAVTDSDLIDLNVSLMIDEDSSKGSVSVADADYRPWWAGTGSNLQHAAMAAVIEN
ncbi:uncharacterized protein A4U43_C07F29570 [Asparagus officinalis]|uniref:C2H2-type domain-containing protein n=1 Tax=Asparagus officinalis TaxID=4686 RepID=A0A5P1EIY9_ASPOF|nr:zinc finger protein ZAT4-like [Asparagus officinalis]ONK64759.1 uncharacterized protein A4U43_C07F29570 [Asparagus officinalis]